MSKHKSELQLALHGDCFVAIAEMPGDKRNVKLQLALHGDCFVAYRQAAVELDKA